MSRRFQIMSGGVVLGVLLFGYAALGFPGLFDMYLAHLYRQATPRAYAIAHDLGSTQADFLTDNAFCTNVYLFGVGSCWKVFHIKTDQSLEQIQPHIDALLIQHGIHNSQYAMPVSITNLLSEANGGEAIILINGQSDYFQLPEPRPNASGHQWSFQDPSGLSTIIDLWELSRSDASFTFHGQRITNNLITITIQVR